MQRARGWVGLPTAAFLAIVFPALARAQSKSSVQITDHNGQDYDWQIVNLETYTVKVTYKSVAAGGGTFVSTVPISPKGQIDTGAQVGSNTVTIVSVAKNQ
ncbi:MAG TPA: hypothetical protein VGC39_00015 [Candidatus Methylacidiphilales bacterium]